MRVRCLPFAHFLATKFDAYHDRGKDDPLLSKDFEDIVYLLDNRTTAVDDIRTATESVQTYLRERCTHLMMPHLQEAIIAHLSPFEGAERWELLRSKLAAITR